MEKKAQPFPVVSFEELDQGRFGARVSRMFQDMNDRQRPLGLRFKKPDEVGSLVRGPDVLENLGQAERTLSRGIRIGAKRLGGQGGRVIPREFLHDLVRTSGARRHQFAEELRPLPDPLFLPALNLPGCPTAVHGQNEDKKDRPHHHGLILTPSLCRVISFEGSVTTGSPEPGGTASRWRS